MGFTRKNADTSRLRDAVYTASTAAKEAMKRDPDNVVNATVGTLCGEDGKIVAFDSVYRHFDAMDPKIKASYAAGMKGNPEFREAVWDWVTQSVPLGLPHTVIAAPGGTGAIWLTLNTFLEPGDTFLVPDIAWSSYPLIAAQNGLAMAEFPMFAGDRFNLAGLREKLAELAGKQKNLAVVLNDPCHNPTGYSMTRQEWHELTGILNEFALKQPVILVDDVAYLDYGQDLLGVRAYMNEFAGISENVMVSVCFSCSKAFTSYGMRLGTAILMAKDQQDITEAENVMEKTARSVWSSAPNAVMENVVWVLRENREAYLREQQSYVRLLKERSSLFLAEAEACGLAVYPYKEGFFITLRIEGEKAARLHQALMREDIYTVLLEKGIRVGICSLPLSRIKGLPARIRQIGKEAGCF